MDMQFCDFSTIMWVGIQIISEIKIHKRGQGNVGGVLGCSGSRPIGLYYRKGRGKQKDAYVEIISRLRNAERRKQ
jgi:hypothetical protein